MKKSITALAIFFVVAAFGNKASSQNRADRDSIAAHTQQLIDGIANGDTTAWAKFLDDSCIITSESGSVKTKEQFIHGIQAPPSFYNAKETISNPIFRGSLNTIIFIYTANLSLSLYGQERLNEICQTDTWIKTNAGWKLISSEALDKPEAPLVQNISPDNIKELVGQYSLSKDYSCKIFEKEGRIFIQRIGKKEVELKCESDYIFYEENVLLLRMIFIHDEKGKVTQLIIRRAGRDITLPKVN